jgi:NitT/TauT family transport system substrate-binding protein
VGTALRRALGGIAPSARAHSPSKTGVNALMAHPTLALVTAAAACMFAQAPARAQGAPEDVTMAVPNITFNLTATFIADELGLWGKHGLRFKMIQVTGIGAANAVIAGSADFSQGGGSTLTRAAARGQRLLAIASTADKNIVAITLRKEFAPGFDPKAPLEKRAQALRGRTIAVGAIQANPHAYLRVIAARGGIDPESIRVTAMEGNAMLGAFQTKAIDGMSSSPPYPLKPVLDGASIVIASGPDGDPPNAMPFAYNIVMARPDTCEKRKSACQKIGRVFNEALAYLHAHPQQTMAILQKKFAALEPALIASAFEEIRKSTPRTAVVTKESIENADDFNVAGGLMKAEDKLKSYDGLFTNEYVR